MADGRQFVRQILNILLIWGITPYTYTHTRISPKGSKALTIVHGNSPILNTIIHKVKVIFSQLAYYCKTQIICSTEKVSFEHMTLIMALINHPYMCTHNLLGC